jgi:hypothetical protein
MLLSMNGKWLQLIRRIHLYLSVFFAPLLLLFVITGWAQTTGFGSSFPLMENLSKVHTGQYYPTTNCVTSKTGKWSFAGQTGTAKNSKETTTWPIKRLIAVMCMALIISISLGLVLAFTVVRNKIFVCIALILGIAVPALLLVLPHLK